MGGPPLPWGGSSGYSLAERLLCAPSPEAYLGMRWINVPRTERAGGSTASAVSPRSPVHSAVGAGPGKGRAWWERRRLPGSVRRGRAPATGRPGGRWRLGSRWKRLSRAHGAWRGRGPRRTSHRPLPGPLPRDAACGLGAPARWSARAAAAESGDWQVLGSREGRQLPRRDQDLGGPASQEGPVRMARRPHAHTGPLTQAPPRVARGTGARLRARAATGTGRSATGGAGRARIGGLRWWRAGRAVGG